MYPKSTKYFFWQAVVKVLSILSIFGVVTFGIGLLALAYLGGYLVGQRDAQEAIISSLQEQGIEVEVPTSNTGSNPTIIKPTLVPWGGVELWEAVNKRRVELGVNPLKKKDELCTIASIRLNELLELGKLDNHEGFGNMPERRPDIKWIFDEFSNVSEFLAQGGSSATETVSLWENTLGHKLIVAGGEYVWGCTYAQDNIAVAIASY